MNRGFWRKSIDRLVLAGCLMLAACASNEHKPSITVKPPMNDGFEDMNYHNRTWRPPGTLPYDPIEIGERLKTPLTGTRAKPIGPVYEDSVQSLAAKLWLIDNARYTLDLAYYIFKRDTVGYAVLGGLCNAVKRGVDVRLTIDSAGSPHLTHSELKALQTCAEDAGFMLGESGRPTLNKARVQVVIVNAISKVFVRWNRRSHDKLIVMDGHVRERAVVMTGGRNISVSYYGINADGSHDPTAYQDMEILLQPGLSEADSLQSVGDSATYYYSLLFLNAGNKWLPPPAAGAASKSRNAEQLGKSQSALAFLKALPSIKAGYDAMPAFLAEGYHPATARLAHELGNLTKPSAISDQEKNMKDNANSIRYIYRENIEVRKPKRIRIVSPYFFFTQHKDSAGKIVFDGAASILKLLEENPDSTFEMVTNSTLTSDNFMAQSVIDMDTVPRMLLSPEMAERWRKGLHRRHVDRALVESPEWRELIDNPRIQIYETGKLDAVEFGGTRVYGKLHAKFMIFDDAGFVGTDNFDYRSRLFNNEFGFFYGSAPLSEALNAEFDQLKANSTRWGSPEWLDMRDRLMAQEGTKSRTTRYQRLLYKFARRSGLIWFF